MKFNCMEKLVASTFIGDGSLWLFLDNKLIIENVDSLTMELAEEGTYVVHWFVAGIPGSSYSITISSPKEARYQLTREIAGSGKDFGAFQFKV